MKPSIAFVAGARPNFMKIAPVLRAADETKAPFTPVIVHTGQHYSREMSDVMFEQLEIRPPDVHLEAGSGTHGQQTAKILAAFEEFLMEISPRLAAVMVVGDVNSTIAAALAASKLHIPVVHLEAGLRSFDRGMPEEINRIATDAISDLLLVSEPAGEKNLRKEGVPDQRIRYVGNVMIDTLVRHLTDGRAANPMVDGQPFALLTLHRPSNVDCPETLTRIVEFLLEVADQIRLIFPAHPRTQLRLQETGLLERLSSHPAIQVLQPLGYVDNLELMRAAAFVITDSGGIQEETSYMSVPCLTLRENTERPVTLTHGTNTLVGLDFQKARTAICEIRSGNYKRSLPIPGWDGRAAYRVVEALSDLVKSAHAV